jgi:hypothetical protein
VRAVLDKDVKPGTGERQALMREKNHEKDNLMAESVGDGVDFVIRAFRVGQ